MKPLSDGAVIRYQKKNVWISSADTVISRERNCPGLVTIANCPIHSWWFCTVISYCVITSSIKRLHLWLSFLLECDIFSQLLSHVRCAFLRHFNQSIYVWGIF